MFFLPIIIFHTLDKISHWNCTFNRISLNYWKSTKCMQKNNVSFSECFFCFFQIITALQGVDRILGQLMNGLKQIDLHRCLNIIVVADHGNPKHSDQWYILNIVSHYFFLSLNCVSFSLACSVPEKSFISSCEYSYNKKYPIWVFKISFFIKYSNYRYGNTAMLGKHQVWFPDK